MQHVWYYGVVVYFEQSLDFNSFMNRIIETYFSLSKNYSVEVIYDFRNQKSKAIHTEFTRHCKTDPYSITQPWTQTLFEIP